MIRLRVFLAALLVSGLFAPLSRAEAVPAVLKGIRVFPAGESFGVEITTDKDFVFTCTKIPPLRRIVIDLPGTEPGRPDAEFKIDSTLVADIRFARIFINDVLLTRILINLKEDAEYSATLDPADRKKLTIMLRKDLAAAVVPAGLSVAAGNRANQALALAQPVVKPTEAVPPSPVTVSAVTISQDTIDIDTSSPLADFKAFTLTEPGRLVIDIPAARSAVNSLTAPANRFGIVTARIGIFEGKLRLVFDTGRQPFPGYSVEKRGTGLQVRLTQK